MRHWVRIPISLAVGVVSAIVAFLAGFILVGTYGSCPPDVQARTVTAVLRRRAPVRANRNHDRLLRRGGECAPDASPRALCRRIEARWSGLRDVVERELSENHQRAFGSPPNDVWSTDRLTSLSVPRTEKPDMEWELTFESANEHRLYTVEMRGWEPVGGVRMDG